jgi:hypothetical protein
VIELHAEGDPGERQEQCSDDEDRDAEWSFLHAVPSLSVVHARFLETGCLINSDRCPPVVPWFLGQADWANTSLADSVVCMGVG